MKKISFITLVPVLQRRLVGCPVQQIWVLPSLVRQCSSENPGSKKSRSYGRKARSRRRIIYSYLIIYLYVWVYVYMSFSLSVCLSIRLSVCLYVFSVFMSFCFLSVRLPVSLSFFLKFILRVKSEITKKSRLLRNSKGQYSFFSHNNYSQFAIS